MKLIILPLLFFLGLTTQAQIIIVKADSTAIVPGLLEPADYKNYQARQWLIGSVSVAGYGGSLLYLNETWYKGYARTGFHTFNDSKEWLQMDKVGHAWTAYNTSRATTAFWQWAGLPLEKSVWIGSLSGFSFLTVIEWLDSYSAKWGWSWSDIGANFAGSGLFAAQELMWQDQKIQFKFSALGKNYDSDVKDRGNELFGKSPHERLLKDYNAQTLWLSFNLNSFMPDHNLPSWLNISVGYGAEGMFGGIANKAFDKAGNLTFNRPDIKRYRQWYLSPDIDFTKIKTNKKGIKVLLSALNTLKFPAPALELSNGKIKGTLIAF